MKLPDPEVTKLPNALLLLCLLLVFWQPINLALTASRSLDSISLGGLPVVLVLVLRLVVAGLGVSAGLALLGRRPAAVTLARIVLVASAATDSFVYLTPYFPHNRAPGETPLYVAGTLLYHAGWLIYLARSSRVRAAFAVA